MRDPHLQRRVAAVVAGGALVAMAASPVWAHFGRPNQLLPAEVNATAPSVSEDAYEGLWEQVTHPVSSDQGDQAAAPEPAETPEPTETPEPKDTPKPVTHSVTHHATVTKTDKADNDDQGENDQAENDDQGENDQADESGSGSAHHESGGDSGDSGGD